MVKFINCILQVRVLGFYGFHLLYQFCVLGSQLSHLLSEVMKLQSLVTLQVGKVEGVLYSGGQLPSSHGSSIVACLSLVVYHLLMAVSPWSIGLVMDWQIRSWCDV